MQIWDWFRIWFFSGKHALESYADVSGTLLPGIKGRFRGNTLNSLTIETEVDESGPTGSVHRRFS